jgi:hypothetical protein
MVMTADQLSQQIGSTVSELEVVIAKNSIVGMDAPGIAELLGVDVTEVQEVMTTQSYRDVRLLLASEYARSHVESDFSWDTVEQQAVAKLAKRVPFENDTDTLLRIAAIANKAQRRSNPMAGKVLDPTAGGKRVALTLTSRIVERLGRSGDRVTEETRQISVLDGSAVNPKFEDINDLLGVRTKPRIAENMTYQTRDADFSLDDLDYTK